MAETLGNLAGHDAPPARFRLNAERCGQLNHRVVGVDRLAVAIGVADPVTGEGVEQGKRLGQGFRLLSLQAFLDSHRLPGLLKGGYLTKRTCGNSRHFQSGGTASRLLPLHDPF
ncbi:hypothetical protein VH570_19410 [Sphingobium sp. HT1-2]|uniref:hypothetical protein n=1 Tax=Sphingobium sp. HT1-2 TaxID=3111640 RepID=UPI003C0532AE